MPLHLHPRWGSSRRRWRARHRHCTCIKPVHSGRIGFALHCVCAIAVARPLPSQCGAACAPSRGAYIPAAAPPQSKAACKSDTEHCVGWSVRGSRREHGLRAVSRADNKHGVKRRRAPASAQVRGRGCAAEVPGGAAGTLASPARRQRRCLPFEHPAPVASRLKAYCSAWLICPLPLILAAAGHIHSW